MNVEVIHDEVDRFNCRMGDGQVESNLRELKPRPIRRREGEMASRLWLDRAKHIGDTAAFVFAVPSGRAPRRRRRGRADIGVERDRLFVQANDRLFGIIRPLLGFQHILHLGDVLFIEIGHAPHFFSATA